MKFGGTSMGSADRLRVAAGIISEQQKKRPLVVVVSAMSKVTDLLLETLRHAEMGDRAAVDASIEALRLRHSRKPARRWPRTRLPMSNRSSMNSGVSPMAY